MRNCASAKHYAVRGAPRTTWTKNGPRTKAEERGTAAYTERETALRFASWNYVTTWLHRIQALRQAVWRLVALNVRGRRGAKGNIIASGCLHDDPDRVHNDLWLVDRDDVTGLLSDDQTSSF